MFDGLIISKIQLRAQYFRRIEKKRKLTFLFSRLLIKPTFLEVTIRLENLIAITC